MKTGIGMNGITVRTAAQRWMVAKMYDLPMMLLVAICLLIAWSRKETE